MGVLYRSSQEKKEPERTRTWNEHDLRAFCAKNLCNCFAPIIYFIFDQPIQAAEGPKGKTAKCKEVKLPT